MTVIILRVDTVAVLAPIHEDNPSVYFQQNIESCFDVRSRSALQMELRQMIKMYLKMKDGIISFYFGVIASLPPKIVIGSSSIS